MDMPNLWDKTQMIPKKLHEYSAVMDFYRDDLALLCFLYAKCETGLFRGYFPFRPSRSSLSFVCL